MNGSRAGDGAHVRNESSVTGNSVQAGVVHGDIHFHQGTAKDTVVPRQLPGAARHFVNRAVEQDMLTTLLNGTSSDGVVLISTIDGTAGVGKSTLAVHWARRQLERFPDGQLYANLRGFDPAADPMTPADALTSFLSALGVAVERIPDDIDARAALFRSLAHDKRLLIVLDNARSAEHVRLLLPGSPRCLVIVTSRNRLDDLAVRHGATRISLNVLNGPEARDLLGQYLGQERLNAEPDAVDALIGHCAGLPLALGLVAVHAAANPDFPLDDLAADLADERERLDRLDSGGETGVRAVFSWSYHSLPDNAARMFRLLGIPTGPDIGLAAAADLAGISHREARRALAELTRANLLEQHAPGRYRFHDLLRAYAAECAAHDETAEDRDAALRRYLDHYVRTGHRMNRQHLPQAHIFVPDPPPSDIAGLTFADMQDFMGWWDTECANIVAAIRQASRLELHPYAWQIPHSLVHPFQLRGKTTDLVAACHTALASVRHLGDRTAEAHVLNDLGTAYYAHNEHTEATRAFEQALALHHEIGDPFYEGMANNNLALLYLSEQRYSDADGLLQRGLELERQAENAFGQGNVHSTLGRLRHELGQIDEAIEHFQKALLLYREIGEEYGVGFVLHGLAETYADADRKPEAIDTYWQVAAHRREIGHRQGEATSLQALGTVLRDSGDIDGARAAWRRALTIFEELGDPEADRLRATLDNGPDFPG
jgi:tetratricopeptide (TPR) repeat protein